MDFGSIKVSVVFLVVRQVVLLIYEGYLLIKIMEILEIAKAFSIGQFEQAFSFLAKDVCRKVLGAGANTFVGRDAVVEQCKQTMQYFESVNTDFKILKAFESSHQAVIEGSAKFSRDGVVLAELQACDVYKFDASDNLNSIISYCIQL